MSITGLHATSVRSSARDFSLFARHDLSLLDAIPFDSQHVHDPIAACSRSRLVSASIRSRQTSTRSRPDSNDQLAFFSIRWSIQPELRFRCRKSTTWILLPTTKEFYDTAGGIENSFKQRSRHTTYPSINIDEEKDEYGVYRDDREFARDLDGHTIPVHTKDIRRLLERTSRDEPAYICLPEHASSFTQTKLNKEAFQKKLDGVYYPLNDSVSWLTTCMEEMKQDIARIQKATDIARPPSIDRRQPQSIDSRQSPLIDKHHHTSLDNRLAALIDTNPPRPHTMKSQPDFHTREEVDQLVEGIYRALETTEERLHLRYDDMYFPMDLTISALTSKVEDIQGELVEIQSYIAR
ncbi:hypothetical protein F2Q69_00006658 [Brassica cretica]|uniref:Uncharacterized protein n=1 Tax=Brassica cretica TaxID=69181 RepID=A0A8S9NYU0_BRACR|nr:hypothetical protein F2Q69_00006658 [Brassica cretica]